MSYQNSPCHPFSFQVQTETLPYWLLVLTFWSLTPPCPILEIRNPSTKSPIHLVLTPALAQPQHSQLRSYSGLSSPASPTFLEISEQVLESAQGDCFVVRAWPNLFLVHQYQIMGAHQILPPPFTLWRYHSTFISWHLTLFIRWDQGSIQAVVSLLNIYPWG
jgi:hypothetical protein